MIAPLTEAEQPTRASATDGMTFQEIAAELGDVSTERARQLVQMAIRRLWRRK